MSTDFARYAHLPLNWTQPEQPDASHAALARLRATFESDATPWQMQDAIARAWGAGFVKPHQQMPREEWAGYFRRRGYFSTGNIPAPTEPIRLYRGAAPGHERGMSWTTSPQFARKFDFALWTCVAQPGDILATFSMMREDLHGDELYEYVVDVHDGLAVEETSAPGHGGFTMQFRGKSAERVSRKVRQLLLDNNLADLRPSALGWRVLHPERKSSLAVVEFSGYPQVLQRVRQLERAARSY